MSKRALIVWGGWDGHEPDRVAAFFERMLSEEGYHVSSRDTLDALLDTDLSAIDLLVPVWTMGEITFEQSNAACSAVRDHGVGVAGCHGGMCDAFRTDSEWQFMTGGQFVAHPGNDGVRYMVRINQEELSPITEGMPDFEVASEQYYMHVDPGLRVLATCDFPTPGAEGPHLGNPCRMPQIWTKTYGKGRVFYTALGHTASILEADTPKEITRRGLLWATR